MKLVNSFSQRLGERTGGKLGERLCEWKYASSMHQTNFIILTREQTKHAYNKPEPNYDCSAMVPAPIKQISGNLVFLRSTQGESFETGLPFRLKEVIEPKF